MEQEKKALNLDKLPFGKFIAFSGGGYSLAANIMILSYLTIYCTDTLKMPPAIVGAVLLVSKVLDGVGELFAGYIVDRSNFKYGKGRTWDLCFIGLWLSVVLLFAIPVNASITIKSIWLFVMYTLNMSVFQTMIQAGSIPYALRAFRNKNVIAKNSVYGGILIMVLAVAFKTVFPGLIESVGSTPEGWTKLIAIFTVPLFLFGIVRFIFVKEIYPVDEPKEERLRFKAVLEAVRGNKYIWYVCGIMFAFQLVSTMNAGTYYFKYIVGDLGLMGMLGLLSVVTLPIMLFFPKFIKRFTVTTLIGISALFAVTGSIITFFAGSNLALLVVGGIITAVGLLAPPYLHPLLIYDCAKYNVWRGKRSMEATMAAIINFGSNVGMGVGSAIVGFLLASSGYVGDAAVQSDSATLMIRLLYSLIPGLFYFMMFICAKMFKLEKRIPQMEKDIAERGV